MLSDRPADRKTLQDLRLMRLQFRPSQQKEMRIFFEMCSAPALKELLMSIENVKNRLAFSSDKEALTFLYLESRRVCVPPFIGGDRITIINRYRYNQEAAGDFSRWFQSTEFDWSNVLPGSENCAEGEYSQKEIVELEITNAYCLLQAKKVYTFLIRAIDCIQPEIQTTEEDKLNKLISLRSKMGVQVSDLVRMFVVARRMKDSINWLDESRHQSLRGQGTAQRPIGIQTKFFIFHEPSAKGMKCGKRCI